MIEVQKAAPKKPDPLKTFNKETQSAINLTVARAATVREQALQLLAVLDGPLAALEDSLNELQRTAERAGLVEDDRETQRGVTQMDTRFSRALEAAKGIRRQAAHLIRSTQRIHQDHARVIARAVARGYKEPGA